MQVLEGRMLCSNRYAFYSQKNYDSTYKKYVVKHFLQIANNKEAKQTLSLTLKNLDRT